MKETRLVILFFVLVCAVFFYKTIFLGLVPFPGDLLIAEYVPWKNESFMGYNPASFPNKAQYFDVIRQLYPWRILSIDLIKQGQLPLWNPYNFSGTPLFANGQAASFYPLNILFFVLPSIVAWSILVFLQPLLSSFFTFLYMRKIGVSFVGCLIASLSFSYSLYTSTFLEYNTLLHVAAWLPLSLYFIEKIVRKEGVIWFVAFCFSSAIPFFAGHLQVSFYVFGFIILYLIFRIISFGEKKQKSIYIGLFLSLLLALGIASLQLIPLFELVQLSARVAHDQDFFINQLLLQPYQYIMLFIPDIFGNPVSRNYELLASYPTKALYIGIPALIFGLTALLNIKKNKYIPLFLLLAFFSIAAIVRTPFTELLFDLHIPFFSSSSPSNGIFLISFCVSVLAGFGFDIWQKNRKFIIPIVSFIIIFFVLFLITIFFGPSINLKNTIYSFAVIIITLLVFFILSNYQKSKHWLHYIFIVVIVLDLFYFFQKFNPFVPIESVYPKNEIISYLEKNIGIDRIWGYGGAYLESNIHTQLRLFSPDGYDPLYPADYGRFIQRSKDGKMHSESDSFTRSNAAIVPGYGSGDLMKNPYRLQMLDSLGVRYILATSAESDIATFPTERFKKLYEKNGIIVFENTKATPRMFLLDKISGFRSGNVILKSYKSNIVEVQTNNKEESMFIISDTYFPGWKVYIDSKQSSISPMFHVFRGVQVPGGKHMVRFVYMPDSFFWGLKISIISLLLLIIFYFVTRKRFHENY